MLINDGQPDMQDSAKIQTWKHNPRSVTPVNYKRGLTLSIPQLTDPNPTFPHDDFPQNGRGDSPAPTPRKVRGGFNSWRKPMSDFVKMIDDMVDAVDELTYCNYRHNRNISTVSPERWEKVYGPQAREMEKRYQLERIANSPNYFDDPVNVAAYENRAR